MFESEPSVSYFAFNPLFTKCNASRLRLPDCFIVFWFVALVCGLLRVPRERRRHWYSSSAAATWPCEIGVFDEVGGRGEEEVPKRNAG